MPGKGTPNQRNLTGASWDEVVQEIRQVEPSATKQIVMAKWTKLQKSFSVLLEFEAWVSTSASGLGAPKQHETPMEFLQRVQLEVPQCK
jgi:hypothetical protein